MSPYSTVTIVIISVLRPSKFCLVLLRKKIARVYNNWLYALANDTFRKKLNRKFRVNDMCPYETFNNEMIY